MKKRNLIAAGIITVLLLTGCQSGSGSTTTENNQTSAVQEQEITSTQPETNTETANTETSVQEPGTQTAADAPDAYTLEELTALITAYEEKVAAAAPNGTDSDLETFFTLKQEENQIDDALDLHEDNLEAQYRSGSLTRDDYKKQERELEKLEDRLDDAEDRLEITFGIDD